MHSGWSRPVANTSKRSIGISGSNSPIFSTSPPFGPPIPASGEPGWPTRDGFGSRPLPLAFEFGDEEVGDAFVLGILLTGVGEVGFVAGLAELLLEGQPHDGRVGGVL